jgi:hypothetical protein
MTKHKIESTTYDGIEAIRPCRTSEDRLFLFYVKGIFLMKCTAGRLQVFAERGCGIWFLHESLEKRVNYFAAELRGIKI